MLKAGDTVRITNPNYDNETFRGRIATVHLVLPKNDQGHDVCLTGLAQNPFTRLKERFIHYGFCASELTKEETC